MRRSIMIVGIACLALAILVWLYLPTLSRYRTLKMQQEQMERDISDLDEKIKELIEEKQLLQSDVQYIEKVIRDEMGLVKPGEVVYKFITDKLKPKTEPPAMIDVPATVQEVPAEPAKTPAQASSPEKPEAAVAANKAVE